VEQSGREVGMARVTLYRKIKSLTGETPVILMRTLRLRLAAQYLRAGRTVQETAEMVGFTDTAYFRKRFKEMYGVLPTEYS
jgi:AraC-like DNA-binding protein